MFLTVCERLQFPDEAVQTLQSALEVLKAFPALEEACACFTDGSQDPTPLLASMAAATGIHQGTVAMVCLVNAVPRLQKVYERLGISQEIMWDTLIDLKCKLIEHRNVEGHWGTDAIAWYRRVFTGKIIKLGRLEYEPITYKWETSYGDTVKEIPVINMHVPSCGSLPPESVLDSLKRAYRYFGTEGQPLTFVAASWMMYPPMCEAVFGKDSNLYFFYSCFDMLEQYADPANKNFWRIFNMHYSPTALNAAPADTTLRRNLLAWMKAGNDMGVGRGAFRFDGKNILHM